MKPHDFAKYLRRNPAEPLPWRELRRAVVIPACDENDSIAETFASLASARGIEETAVVVVKMLNGFLYLTALRAYTDGYSDTTLKDRERSKYFDAYLNGRLLSSNLLEGDFRDFIGYAALIARRGAEEMFGGNISPSPYSGVCEYCKMGGMCGFAAGSDADVREVSGVTCADIAHAVQKRRGDK